MAPQRQASEFKGKAHRELPVRLSAAKMLLHHPAGIELSLFRIMA
jgi:hypothetical protein